MLDQWQPGLVVAAFALHLLLLAATYLLVRRALPDVAGGLGRGRDGVADADTADPPTPTTPSRVAPAAPRTTPTTGTVGPA